MNEFVSSASIASFDIHCTVVSHGMLEVAYIESIWGQWPAPQSNFHIHRHESLRARWGFKGTLCMWDEDHNMICEKTCCPTCCTLPLFAGFSWPQTFPFANFHLPSSRWWGLASWGLHQSTLCRLDLFLRYLIGQGARLGWSVWAGYPC